jgi:hypothetical protein
VSTCKEEIKNHASRLQRLMTIILATQEAEIRKNEV